MTVRLTLENIRTEGERFMQEVSREYYEAHAGLKSAAALQPIYARHERVIGPDALALACDALAESAEGTEEQRRIRMLVDWLAELQASRELAPSDEREIIWESTAVATLRDGETVPYERLAIEIANTEERARRTALEGARERLVSGELAALRSERIEREREIMVSLELGGDYLSSFERLSGISLSMLASQCADFLRVTQAMWDDTHSEFVRRGLGIHPREATRGDALFLLRAREYDRYFPASDMEPSVRRHVSEMGLDPLAGGRVTYDLGEREGKRARAFCAPVRIPTEVYLVLRPHGGQTDWSTLLHELGHALHFANISEAHPFEYRWLGDNAITEGYAMLFDHRMQDGGWLRRYTGLGKREVRGYLRSSAFEELHFLRRYCGKILYELDLYGGQVPWQSLPDSYVERLTGATSFRYSPADAFVDVDPRFYSARYLRAWQLQAVLASALVDRFNEDWYRNPRTGPFLVQELLAEGQRELAEEQAARVAGGTLSFAPLVRSIERLLAA